MQIFFVIIMEFINDIVSQLSEDIQAIILICAVAALGTKLGKIKILNISLGITFVFFIGIVLGHFQVPINKPMLHFAQNAGLILFIYALGLQVGPGFFSSLKSSGLTLNILALSVIALGVILTIACSFIFGVSIPNMVGILCGAVTNTPALGAAQQAMASVPNSDPRVLTDMALATAITYPMGVVGVILAIIFLKKIGAKAEELVSTEEKSESDNNPYIAEFKVTNPALNGTTIKELMQVSSKKFIISRVDKGDKVVPAQSDTVIELNNTLIVICSKHDVKAITALLGQIDNVDLNKNDIDWNNLDNSQLVSKKIVITQGSINGKKLGSLKLRNIYGVNVTQVKRVGIRLLATTDLSLQVGDTVTVVGKDDEVRKVTALLGDRVKQLNNPNLIPVFLGIALGLILGAIPISLPGMSMPIKLGIAGGPILVGILMGAFGPRLKITTYTTQSTNLFMREFGLVIYLACLGIDSGGTFFETIVKPEGLLWIALGFLITTLPVLIIGVIAMKRMKIDFEHSVGMLCGSMANPIALAYINSQTESDNPAVSYATVYPISTFIRIITAQLLIMIFM